MINWLRGVAATGNVIRFLLSFVLAFALWAWVTIERDPEQTYRAPDVPVIADGLPVDLSLVDRLTPIEVTLFGPRSVIQTVDSGSIQASIDLSTIDQAGEYTRPILVDAPDGIRKVETEPASVTFEVDSVVSKEFDLGLLSPEDLPRNLAVTDTSVSTEVVTVTGVGQNVDRVAQVLLPVEIAGQTSGFTADVMPRAVDSNNQEVIEVDVSPERVTLTVDLEVRGKEVPVFVQCGLSGGCAAHEGFEVLGLPQASPATVLVDGPEDQLSAIQFVYTVPVNTADLSKTTVVPNVPIDTSPLGAGITVQPSVVNVSVQIQEAVFQRQFDGLSVVVLNSPGNARVSVSPAVVSISLEGPRDAIEALQADEISVVVDVSDLGAGMHQIIPQVVLPPRVRYSDAPDDVTVTIVVIEPTATPSPQPTPDATGTQTPEATATP